MAEDVCARLRANDPSFTKLYIENSFSNQDRLLIAKALKQNKTIQKVSFTGGTTCNSRKHARDESKAFAKAFRQHPTMNKVTVRNNDYIVGNFGHVASVFYQNKRLCRLRLDSIEWSEKGVARQVRFLLKTNSLECVELYSYYGEYIEYIDLSGSLGCNQSIKNMLIYCDNLSHETLRDIPRFLDGNQMLEVFDFQMPSKCPNDLQVSIVCAMKHHKSLRKLNLYVDDMNDLVAEELGKVAMKTPTLKSLRVENNSHLGIEALRQLVNGLKESSIKNLFMEEGTIMNCRESARLLAGLLRSNSNLRSVALGQNMLGGDEGMALIAAALAANTKLESLSLNATIFGPTECRLIADALTVNTSLKSIDLSFNDAFWSFGDDLDPSLAMVLQVLQGNSFLESVCLEGCEFGDREVARLADALVGNTSLKSIDLGFNHFGDEGAASVAVVLEANTCVQSIEIRGCRIGSRGAIAIADALVSNTSLKSIDLSSNDIGEEGASALAKALEANACLQTIGLSKCGLGPEGITRLGQGLIGNTSLKSIDLSANHIGDDSVIAFAEVIEANFSLEQLKITYLQGVDRTRLEFYLELNRGGRRILNEAILASLWPLILGRSSHFANILFFFLQEKNSEIVRAP